MLYDEGRSLDVGRYCVRVDTHIAHHWLTEPEGLTATWADDGTTYLNAIFPDQAALHGLLARIRDLGLTLLSVERMPDHPASAPPDTS
jgi:hypothetical protein